jgi:hypothetical protein
LTIVKYSSNGRWNCYRLGICGVAGPPCRNRITGLARSCPRADPLLDAADLRLVLHAFRRRYAHQVGDHCARLRVIVGGRCSLGARGQDDREAGQQEQAEQQGTSHREIPSRRVADRMRIRSAKVGAIAADGLCLMSSSATHFLPESPNFCAASPADPGFVPS